MRAKAAPGKTTTATLRSSEAPSLRSTRRTRKAALHPDIREILFTEKQIQAKVEEMAERISEDYAGKEVVLVCALKGATVFLADLMRRLTIPTIVDFVDWSSYGSSTSSSGVFRV